LSGKLIESYEVCVNSWLSLNHNRKPIDYLFIINFELLQALVFLKCNSHLAWLYKPWHLLLCSFCLSSVWFWYCRVTRESLFCWSASPRWNSVLMMMIVLRMLAFALALRLLALFRSLYISYIISGVV